MAIRNPLFPYLARASHFLEIFSPSSSSSICGLPVSTTLFLFILYSTSLSTRSDLLCVGPSPYLDIIKTIKDKFGLEAFTQYEFNRFLLLSSRQLFGAGARLKMEHGENSSTFFGVGMMNESEEYDISIGEENKNIHVRYSFS